MLSSLVTRKSLRTIKGFRSSVLYIITDCKQNCFQGIRCLFCVKCALANTLELHLYRMKLYWHLPLEANFMSQFFYLWLWNKILTHLNFSSKDPLSSVGGGHLKKQLLVLSSQHCPASLKKWIPILICPFIMNLVDLRPIVHGLFVLPKLRSL